MLGADAMIWLLTKATRRAVRLEKEILEPPEKRP